MKKGLHPKTKECKVVCACGNSFITMSNISSLRIDVCNKCHPFFTGNEKVVDSAGRVDKFKRKYEEFSVK